MSLLLKAQMYTHTQLQWLPRSCRTGPILLRLTFKMFNLTLAKFPILSSPDPLLLIFLIFIFFSILRYSYSKAGNAIDTYAFMSWCCVRVGLYHLRRADYYIFQSFVVQL